MKLQDKLQEAMTEFGNEVDEQMAELGEKRRQIKQMFNRKMSQILIQVSDVSLGWTVILCVVCAVTGFLVGFGI
jgi:hypothetical protein